MGKKRTEDFRIGYIHGKIFAQNQESEAQLRNEIFLIGMLRLEEQKNIKLVAYEMPLEAGQSRGMCIDLFGYDQYKKPWIIELKKTESNETIEKIKNQLNCYEKKFIDVEVKDGIEEEIQKRYHWEDFKFSEGVGKIILAGRDLINTLSMEENFKDSGIYVCSFSRIQNEKTLLEKNKGGVVQLRIHNK